MLMECQFANKQLKIDSSYKNSKLRIFLIDNK